ncbi:hypothetical protein OUZ56_033063 [Daphnia magna]|uniref:Uncharacterized protein n=1 Tax=Daphnia magna TaxID=35525 RepID=A0ABQ9ZXD8_9CRUS|nr:hypothetical protein OUZ56_033063 [Daphnia magna]
MGPTAYTMPVTTQFPLLQMPVDPLPPLPCHITQPLSANTLLCPSTHSLSAFDARFRSCPSAFTYSLCPSSTHIPAPAVGSPYCCRVFTSITAGQNFRCICPSNHSVSARRPTRCPQNASNEVVFNVNYTVIASGYTSIPNSLCPSILVCNVNPLFAREILAPYGPVDHTNALFILLTVSPVNM